MGVYIKGMEMPESCNGCPVNLVGHCLAHEWLYVGRENLEYNSKPEWCPLVPVPPHGRLIDADALKVKAIERSEKCGVCVNVLDNVITAYDIETAPTIIPTEEG